MSSKSHLVEMETASCPHPADQLGPLTAPRHLCWWPYLLAILLCLACMFAVPLLMGPWLD